LIDQILPFAIRHSLFAICDSLFTIYRNPLVPNSQLLITDSLITDNFIH